MWIFTREGFYSVVTAEEFGYPLQIRARSVADLDRLRSTHLRALAESIRLTGRDYPVRAFADHTELAGAVSGMVHSIDYANFKGEVGRRQGYGRSQVYAKVWSDCLQIESENESN